MKSKMKRKPYSEMTTAELAEATKQYDTPGGEPKFLRPPAKQRARHDKIVRAIRRQRGRPVVGAGAKRIQLTMERGLLSKADAYARQAGITRSQLFAKGVRAILAGAA